MPLLTTYISCTNPKDDFNILMEDLLKYEKFFSQIAIHDNAVKLYLAIVRKGILLQGISN